MDIQAYLDRIGYTGTRDLTLANLSRLIRCHLETVPFENLDCYPNGFPLSNDPTVLFEKVVTRRRGGVCFELNGLFYALLNAMGYDCYPIEVRLPGVLPSPKISHEGTIVRIDGRKYYCDVGYGGPSPKDAMPIDTEEEQLIYGTRYRVIRDTQQIHLQRFHEDKWVYLISFADTPCIWQDFIARLYYYSTHPDSRFRRERVLNLCLPCGGSKAISGTHMTIRRNGTVTETELETEEALNQAIREEFGIYI